MNNDNNTNTNKPIIVEDVRVDMGVRIIPTASGGGGGRSRSPHKRSREGEGSDGAETCRATKREKPEQASSKERRPSYVPAGSAAENILPTTKVGVKTRTGRRSAEPKVSNASSQGPAAPRAAFRGRPSEGGKYIGVGRLQEERRKKREEERFREVAKQRLREEAIEREERNKLGLPSAWPPLPKKGGSTADASIAPMDEDTPDDEEAKKRSPKEALKRLDQQVEVIRKVAKCSSNLKGMFIKELKDAATLIQEEARALHAATSTEKTRRLKKENKKLRREMDEFSREVAEIKKYVRTKRALPGEKPPQKKREVAASAASPPTEGGSIKDIIARVINSMALMVDGKMAALEDRLFPKERPMRPPPPLEADKRREAANKQRAPSARPEENPPRAARGAATRESAAPAVAKAGRPTSSRRKDGPGHPGCGQTAGTLPPPTQTLATQLQDMGESWVEITKKGKKKVGAVQQQAPPKSGQRRRCHALEEAGVQKESPQHAQIRTEVGVEGEPPQRAGGEEEKKKRKPQEPPAVVLTSSRK